MDTQFTELNEQELDAVSGGLILPTPLPIKISPPKCWPIYPIPRPPYVMY